MPKVFGLYVSISCFPLLSQPCECRNGSVGSSMSISSVLMSAGVMKKTRNKEWTRRMLKQRREYRLYSKDVANV